MKITLRDMCYISLMAVMIAVCSWISLPLGAVPITFQTFGAAAALTILGGRRGTLSIAVYVVLGLIGIPVFAGFKGGAAVLFGMTGGYIFGFLLMGLCYTLLTRFISDELPVRCAALGLGLLLCYAFGTIWFMVLYTRTKGQISVLSALGMCVFPFIIPDIIKLAVAVLLARRVTPLIDRIPPSR